MFAFFNPHDLLQNKSHEPCLNALENIYEDEIDFSELIVEIDKFKRLVRSGGTTFERDATAIHVLQWLTNCQLLDSTPYLCLCLKLYLTIGVSIASCERSFSKLKWIKSYLRSTMGKSRLSVLVILSIESEFIEKLDFSDNLWFCFVKGSTS